MRPLLNVLTCSYPIFGYSFKVTYFNSKESIPFHLKLILFSFIQPLTIMVFLLFCFALANAASASSVTSLTLFKPTSIISQDMAKVVNVGGRYSFEERMQAYEVLSKQQLIPSNADGLYPELVALEFWGQKGHQEMLPVAAELFIHEFTKKFSEEKSKYQGGIAEGSAIQAMYNFAFVTNKKSEIENAMIALLEKIYGHFDEAREISFFGHTVKTENGVEFVEEIFEPKLIYQFYLNRLREKKPNYITYTVNHLIKADRQRALNDIAAVILELDMEGKSEVAQKLYEKVLRNAEAVLVDATMPFIGSVLPMDPALKDYLRWMKRLARSLKSEALKSDVQTKLSEMQKKVDSKAREEKFHAANPEALQKLKDKINSRFGARPENNSLGAISCQKLFGNE